MWPFTKKSATTAVEVVAPEAQKTELEVISETPNLTIQLSALPEALLGDGFYYGVHDGEKYPGGYGPTPLLTIDYWTLRARSSELFETNIYARGILRRLVTSVINMGLTIEATPRFNALGIAANLDEWTERTEQLFDLWGSVAKACDFKGEATFSQLQRTIYREALVDGDILVQFVQGQHGLPTVKLTAGSHVRTPLTAAAVTNIVHGVELDENGRQVAYHVRKPSPTDPFGFDSQRVPAYDSRGRRIAWLVYGTNDHRFDQVRGQPLLALAIQSLKDIDRFRDSTQRKALIASLLALIVTKKDEAVGTKPLANLGGGFSRQRGSAIPTQSGGERRLRVGSMMPGAVVDELGAGEDIKSIGGQGTDEKFGDFESAIIQSLAWHVQVPPEVLVQSFNANYAASQAANNEFKSAIDVIRDDFGDQFVKQVYVEFLISSVLAGTISAPGLADALRDPVRRWHDFAAWTSSEMSGAVKPSVDPLKLAKAYEVMVAQGFMTRARVAREIRGGKFTQIVRQLRTENELLVEANRPITALTAPSPSPPSAPAQNDAEEGDERDEGDGGESTAAE